jgi:hypothetical protein
MADLNTGFRAIAAPGNASADTSWFLNDLAAGTYYFRVQAIDNGFMPGGFSTPLVFSFAPVGMDDLVAKNPVSISPNPFTGQIRAEGVYSGTLIQVFNSCGRVVYDGKYNGPVNTSNWQKGIYMFRFSGEDGIVTTRAIKN